MGPTDYSSPEQYEESGSFDGSSLVYSLGALLYHLLSKRNPASSPFNLVPLASINPLVSRSARALVTKATEKESRHRFQHPEELRRAVKLALKMPADETLGGSVSKKKDAPDRDILNKNALPVNPLLAALICFIAGSGFLAFYYFLTRQ
jgi:serine/threonine protein kinase